MAYGSADHARWQQMPFILGFTVKLSGNHPCEDICDILQGDYPKEFKFVGWHPWCRCYTVAKLPSDADFLKYAESEDIDNYQFKGVVKDVPPQFTQWVQDNQQRIMAAKSLPYFIKDNGKISKNGYVLGFKGRWKENKHGGHRSMHDNKNQNQAKLYENIPNMPLATLTDEQRNNITKIAYQIGYDGKEVRRIKPMDWENADQGMANSLYDNTQGYKNNCQSVVIAQELRFRGLDVAANAYADGGLAEKISKNLALAYIDPVTKEMPTTIPLFESKEKLLSYIDNEMAHNGRFVFGFDYWKGKKNGHIINVIRVKGKTYCVDSQDGAGWFDIENIVDKIDFTHKVQMFRVDEMLFNTDVAELLIKM